MKIQHQLSNPDAFFYELSASRESISGMFQGEEIQPFQVSRLEFLEAALSCGLIGDYNEHPGGRVFVFNGYDGYDTDEAVWIAWACEDGPANEILKEVFRIKLENELAEIDAALNVPSINTHRINSEMDESFCVAVLELADIIRAVNPEWATLKRQAV